MEKTLSKLKYFVLGFICFTVFQIFLRLPILNLLSKNSDFVEFSNSFYLLFGLLLALSAGIFEEFGKYLILKISLKGPFNLYKPILFGLGHSLAEILILLKPFLTNEYSFNALSPLFFLERLCAFAIHIGLTFIIFNGFIKNAPLKAVSIAIIIHALIDFLIPVSKISGLNPLTLEIIFVVISILLIIYINKSKKLYKKG